MADPGNFYLKIKKQHLINLTPVISFIWGNELHSIVDSTAKLPLEVFAAAGQLFLSFTSKFAAPSAMLLEVLVMLHCKLSFRSNMVEYYFKKGITSYVLGFFDWFATCLFVGLFFFLNGYHLNNLVYSLALHAAVSVQLRM